jgi:hypothetical protein
MWYIWFSLATSASWIDIMVVEYTCLRDHFVNFTYLAGGSRTRTSLLFAAHLTCLRLGRVDEEKS